MAGSSVGRSIAALALVAALAGVGASAAAAADDPTRTSELLRRDVIVNSDIWAEEPRMMAAGLGFTKIIGVPGLSLDDLQTSEQRVRAAGGTWNRIDCPSGSDPSLGSYTSAATPSGIAYAYGYPTTFSDGLPVEFSWPIRPSTLGPTDFRVQLNTGERVTPELAAVYPNFEYNERSVAVLFGKFGNRIPSTEAGSRFPVRVSVVEDETPLELVGEDGPASAVGLAASKSTSPYDRADDPEQRTGPQLTGAKLTTLSDRGENAPAPFRGALPNDGVTLYNGRGDFRLRIYTTGGFSPDGVRGVFPTEFSRYFRVHTNNGKHRKRPVRILGKTAKTYTVHGHKIKVLGLADLGQKQRSYDDCYQEDRDNYIDIILAGERKAARRITDVQIPARGRYSPFYNPGGPGNDPTLGVRYSAPGPSQMQKVWKTLNDPRTVTFRPGASG